MNQLVVVVNKLDTVGWDQTRFLEIANKLGSFLRQAGYRDSDVSFVPCSGLSGQNLTSASTEDALSKWYHGPTLLDCIGKPVCTVAIGIQNFILLLLRHYYYYLLYRPTVFGISIVLLLVLYIFCCILFIYYLI